MTTHLKLAGFGAAATLALVLGIWLWPGPAAAQTAEPACSWREGDPPPIIDGYILFFDWDNAAIQEPAASILNNVVAASTCYCPCLLTIIAHADRSGSVTNNRALARRRAEAIADYLSRRIVDATIRIEIGGEDRPLVGTADGVRHPENRRAEIYFNPSARLRSNQD